MNVSREREWGRLCPRSSAIHILVLAEMRDISDHCARLQRHLLPHAIIYDADRGPQTKHPRVLLAEEGDGYGHPELDVPLVLANLRVCPVILHDNSERGIEHLL